MNMKKRLCGIVLTLAMILSMFPATVKAAETPVDTPAEAETRKDIIPDKIRLYSSSDDTTNDDAIVIELGNKDHSIDKKSIKTNSKNLKAILTRTEYEYEVGSISGEPRYKNSYTIGIQSKKKGTYTVSFNIVDKDKKKIATKEVTLYIYDNPIKSITFDGKALKFNDLPGDSAKVKVTLASGYKLQMLRYGVYVNTTDEDGDISTESVYKKFKNGSKITFGKKSYEFINSYISEYGDRYYETRTHSLNTHCPTYIEITYYDKYTKRTEVYQAYYAKSLYD